MAKSLTTCPFCGQQYDLLQHLAEGDLRDYVVALASMPGDVQGLVRDYIDLWRSKPGASLQMGRRARIAAEVAKLWKNGVFEAAGNYYEISKADIVKSLEMAVAAKPIGLPNHNYLKKIMREKGRRAAANAEHQVEADRRAGKHRQEQPQAAAVEPDEKHISQWTAEEAAGALMKLWAKPAARQVMMAWGEQLEDRLYELGVDHRDLYELYVVQPGADPRQLLEKCKKEKQ